MSHKVFRSLFVLTLIIGLMAGLALQSASAAGPWYVAPTGDNNNDCLSPSTSCATINGAIGKATNGDTIFVATGTYTDAAFFTVAVYINKNLTLSGGWNAAFTTHGGLSIIDGQNARLAVNVVQSDVSLDHFAIQNGRYDIGGAILVDNSNLTINNSAIINNTSTHYGSIYTYSSTVTFNNSTISGNLGTQAGGIYTDNFTVLSINNTTIAYNTSLAGGGGIFRPDQADVVTITMSNSILANNSAAYGLDCYGIIGSSGYNLIGNNSGCTFTSTTGDLTNLDPLIGPLQNNGSSTFTHALLTGSSAIDTGNPAVPGSGGNACLATDQRGVARPQGSTCDIGAFELEAAGGVEEVSIDIIPGNQSNLINRNSLGTIPVAILSSADFNALSAVDRTSLTFGRTGDEHSLVSCNNKGKDVNGDGLMDLVCNFNPRLAGFQISDTVGILKGNTVNGVPIEGQDTVKIVKK